MAVNREIITAMPYTPIHSPNATALCIAMAQSMADAVQHAADIKNDNDAMKAHECDMCNTRHIDGNLCDANSCEHDYDSDKADDGWMVCIYCHHETEWDDDGHVEYDYQNENWE